MREKEQGAESKYFPINTRQNSSERNPASEEPDPPESVVCLAVKGIPGSAVAEAQTPLASCFGTPHDRVCTQRSRKKKKQQ